MTKVFIHIRVRSILLTKHVIRKELFHNPSTNLHEAIFTCVSASIKSVSSFTWNLQQQSAMDFTNLSVTDQVSLWFSFISLLKENDDKLNF